MRSLLVVLGLVVGLGVVVVIGLTQAGQKDGSATTAGHFDLQAAKEKLTAAPGALGGLYAQANELLYRRLDIADAVSAHLLAAECAPAIGFARYIVSATSPFEPRHLAALARDAAGVVRELYPECAQLYAARGWRPEFDFAHVLRSLQGGRDFRSALAREVGSKGYHDTRFEDGPYPVGS